MEIWRVKLISTQVVVEVEVGVELGNFKDHLKVQRYENSTIILIGERSCCSHRSNLKILKT